MALSCNLSSRRCFALVLRFVCVTKTMGGAAVTVLYSSRRCDTLPKFPVAIEFRDRFAPVTNIYDSTERYVFINGSSLIIIPCTT
jgi:hypothetical protein